MNTFFTRDQVMAVPTPARTRSWGVLSHQDVIQSMVYAADQMDVDTEQFNESYQLTHEGKRMFGVWTFGKGTIVPAIGFRHSMDKSFSWGIAAGTSVYVCSNLCISGDFVNFIVQRGNVNKQEAFQFAESTLATTVNISKNQVGWLHNLKNVGLTVVERKAFTFDLLDQQIVPFGKLPKFQESLLLERRQAKADDYDDESLYVMHNAFTRFTKRLSYGTQYERARKLQGITAFYERLAA